MSSWFTNTTPPPRRISTGGLPPPPGATKSGRGILAAALSGDTSIPIGSTHEGRTFNYGDLRTLAVMFEDPNGQVGGVRVSRRDHTGGEFSIDAVYDVSTKYPCPWYDAVTYQAMINDLPLRKIGDSTIDYLDLQALGYDGRVIGDTYTLEFRFTTLPSLHMPLAGGATYRDPAYPLGSLQGMDAGLFTEYSAQQAYYSYTYDPAFPPPYGSRYQDVTEHGQIDTNSATNGFEGVDTLPALDVPGGGGKIPDVYPMFFARSTITAGSPLYDPPDTKGNYSGTTNEMPFIKALDDWSQKVDFRFYNGKKYIPFATSSTLITGTDAVGGMKRAQQILAERGAGIVFPLIAETDPVNVFAFDMFVNDGSAVNAYYPYMLKLQMAGMGTSPMYHVESVPGKENWSVLVQDEWPETPLPNNASFCHFFKPVLHVGHIVNSSFVSLKSFTETISPTTEIWIPQPRRAGTEVAPEGWLTGMDNWFQTMVIRWRFKGVAWDFSQLAGGLKSPPVMRVALPWMPDYPNYTPWDNDYVY